MDEVKEIKKIFSKKDFNSMPCALIEEIYNKLSKEYNTKLAGMVGAYLLGRIHEANKNDG